MSKYRLVTWSELQTWCDADNRPGLIFLLCVIVPLVLCVGWAIVMAILNAADRKRRFKPHHEIGCAGCPLLNLQNPYGKQLLRYGAKVLFTQDKYVSMEFGHYIEAYEISACALDAHEARFTSQHDYDVYDDTVRELDALYPASLISDTRPVFQGTIHYKVKE